MRAGVYFREVQRPWLWVLPLVTLATPAIVLFIALHRAFPIKGGSDRALYVVCGPIVLLAVWFTLAGLIVEVRDAELSIRFFLLWPERIIRWQQIRHAKVITFESSSLGVRWGPEGRVYRVWGNRGVRIELRNGESIFVGSQRAYELADAIAERVAALPEQVM